MVHYIVAEIVISAVLFVNNLHTGIVNFKVLKVPCTVLVVECHIHSVFGTFLILVVLLTIVLKPVCKVALVESNCILPVVAVLIGFNHFTAGILGDPIHHFPQPQVFFLVLVTAFIAVADHLNTKIAARSGNHGRIGRIRCLLIIVVDIVGRQVFCSVDLVRAGNSLLVRAVQTLLLLPYIPTHIIVALSDG